MEPDTVAALIAFFALGANLLGTAFKLILDPGGRATRWFALFELDIMVWLAVQGWLFARGEMGSLAPVYEASVHMLPALFLASALVEVRRWSDWRALAVVAVGVATLPLSVGNMIGGDPDATMIMGWQIVGWTTGTVVHMGERPARTMDPGVRRRLRWAVTGTLMAIGPIAVVVGWFAGGDFFVFVMPILTVGMQILILIGILHLRFYDVEIRAVRSGETAARAAEMERLAVVGELAASFAHEVRNPLTGVRSLAQRLAEEELTDEKRRSYADLIVREAERVEGIVTRTLGLARRTPGREAGRGPTPLAPLFEDLRLLVLGGAERDGVELRATAGVTAAPAARDPLAQALLNLLLNAVAHSPRGGVVELLARSANGGVEILVRDEGPGVPVPDRKRVFDPLYSGTGGTGLGLAVVRRIAEEQGWSVAIDDAPGGGAEFRLGIPA